MTRWHWFMCLTAAAVPFAACGPDRRPEGPCDGPSFNLVVRTETGDALPADTRINVRYGGNPEGEPYTLGERHAPQAVSCSEDAGGAPSEDEATGGAHSAGAPSIGGSAVRVLRCGLYTQGPARVDVTATGYEPIEDEALSLERKKHCEVPIELKLLREKPDAGSKL